MVGRIRRVSFGDAAGALKEAEMIQEIGSNIVTFLLGAALTFFLSKWTNLFHKIDSLEFGVRALLRNKMIQTVNYYREKKKLVPQWELESFDQMYDASKQLGEDGYLEALKDVMHGELEHETH